MNDEMEIWTVRAFDDASARVGLPPPERWVPTEVEREHAAPVLAAATIAVLLALGVIVWRGVGDRLVPASTPKPTASGLLLVPGASEDSTWGGVYEHSLGATVLRPTWLPFTVEKTNSSLLTGGRFINYGVGYVTNDYKPLLIFLAESLDQTPSQLAPGEHATDVTVRGHDARLITAPDGRPRVIWTENDVRYTVQAVSSAISAGDLLRIVEGLAAVVSPSGATR
jgi:hypothetical protein